MPTIKNTKEKAYELAYAFSFVIRGVGGWTGQGAILSLVEKEVLRLAVEAENPYTV
ncbi:hypothetical protein [Litchfieldia alkalitelluris]|uniref:hypothetical protein n=1 Tax=Litchfieldia alkalitelluris TaxID=304268 RepID=UPI0014742914|nr:hypothetical protein [Litchfieldia alkalitelluris]